MVFALCSVLDIGDSSGYVAEQSAISSSPGKYWWGNRGTAKVIFGYCAEAPVVLDNDVKVLKKWDGKTVKSWLESNLDITKKHYAVTLTDSDYTTVEGYQPKINVYWCFMKKTPSYIIVGVPEMINIENQLINQWEKKKTEWILIDLKGDNVENLFK